MTDEAWFEEWVNAWEEYVFGRAPLEPWDPKPPTRQSTTIPGVACSAVEQKHIEDAAYRQHTNRAVAAEMSRTRAGYAGLFDAHGNII